MSLKLGRFLVTFRLEEASLVVSGGPTHMALPSLHISVHDGWWASMNAASGPCTMPGYARAFRHAHG